MTGSRTACCLRGGRRDALLANDLLEEPLHALNPCGCMGVQVEPRARLTQFPSLFKEDPQLIATCNDPENLQSLSYALKVVAT
jgi:hypothetical protein